MYRASLAGGQEFTLKKKYLKLVIKYERINFPKIIPFFGKKTIEQAPRGVFIPFQHIVTEYNSFVHLSVVCNT